MSKTNTPIAEGKNEGLLKEIMGKLTEQPYHTDLGRIGGIANQIIESMLGIIQPFAKVQGEAAKLARTVGLASSSIMSMARNIVAQNKAFSLSMSYGVSDKQIQDLQYAIMSGLGRNFNVNDLGGVNKEGKVVTPNMNSAFEDLIAASTIFGADNVSELVTQYDKLGMSMKAAGKTTTKLYKEAGQYGINLQKYTQNFVNNLDMAQRYNFRDGVKGVKEMARKATEIRQNMQQVAAFAEKVGTVTGAVETAANLQVLGGAFTQLANPLAMLNESLTDVGALQDRLNKMAQGAAYYDSTTHQVKMDPLTRMRMKAAANAAGIDPNNFLEQAFTEARRNEIKSQMSGYNFGGSENMEKLAKLLPNIGQIDEETGMAGATVNGEFVSLDKLTESPELLNQLLDENISEEENIREIAKHVMKISEVVGGKGYQLENAEAANKIKPGLLGPSVYNTMIESLFNDFDEKFVAGIEKMDWAVDLLPNTTAAFGKKFMGQLGQVMNASTFEELSNNIDTFTAEMLPEGEFRTILSDKVLKPIASSVNDLSKGINNVLKDAGVDFRVVFTDVFGTTGEGGTGNAAATNGNAATPPPANPTKTEVQPTAYTNPASQTSDDSVSQTIKDIAASMGGVTLGSASLDNVTIDNIIQGITGNGIQNGTEIAPGREESTKVLQFTGNSETMSSTPVSPTTQSTTTEQGSTASKDVNVNLNFGGNSTLTIIGDNGKIAEEDLGKLLQKWFENNRGAYKSFVESITKEIASQQ